MKLSAIKEALESQGILDHRQLMTYATLSGTIRGAAFQNVVAICFQPEQLQLYRANLDNTLGELLLSCPYREISGYDPHNRFLYSYTAFSWGTDRFRFFNYDKKVFAQGFRDAGIAAEK